MVAYNLWDYNGYNGDILAYNLRELVIQYCSKMFVF